MKQPPFRALLSGLFLVCLSAVAQVPNSNAQRINPQTQRINPQTQRINPQTQRIDPAWNRIVPTPVQPTIVSPVIPPVVSPPHVVPPGTIIFTPPSTVLPGTGYIVPTYPSAWIGPTIIRETHGEPAPDPNTAAPTVTDAAQMPTLRLVAVLGSLRRLDVGSGADLGLAEAPLGVSVGMLVGYGDNKAVRASGDFFGTCWDGPMYFTKAEDSRGGPFLDHPIMTVNEMRPGPWEPEAGVAGRRIGWMRLAVALFEDRSQNPNAKQVNLPRGRRAAMREVLHRVTWTDKGVSAKSAGVSEAAALAGGDITHFGNALATFAEKTMAPTPDNERVGIAEWFFPAQDLGKVLAVCPRFFTETPDGAMLRQARAAAGATTPAWVRTCEIRNDKARYAAELWFVVVPDAAFNAWLLRR